MRSRVKEGGALSAYRIKRVHLIAFECVAKAAGKPEIALVVRPASSRRDDVFDLQPTEYKMLRALAVATTVSRPMAHADAGRLWNPAHGCTGGRKPRATASRNP